MDTISYIIILQLTKEAEKYSENEDNMKWKIILISGLSLWSAVRELKRACNRIGNFIASLPQM